MAHCPYRYAQTLQHALASGKMRVAFLIGAGCPMSIRVPNTDASGVGTSPLIPDIRTLTQKVRQTIEAEAAVDPKKGTPQQACLAILNEVTGLFHDQKDTTIEHILSHVRLLLDVIQKDALGKISKTDLQALDKRICEIITELVSREIPEDQKSVSPYHHFASWIAAIPREQPVEIFTTNYDLLIEQALEQQRVPYFDGFIGSHQAFFDLASIDHVSVGRLASAESIPALVDINKLLTRHSAVVGTTGAGKSTTVAGLLTSLSNPERYPSSRIVVFDIHGEYAKALQDRCTVYRVGSSSTLKPNERPLHVPYWALNFDEFAKVCLGTAESKDAAAIQDRLTAAKTEAFKKHPKEGLTVERVTVDTPVPFSIHQLWYDLHCEVNGTFREEAGKPQNREMWALEKDGAGNDVLGDPMTVVPPSFLPIKDIKEDKEKIRLSKSTLPRKPIDVLATKLRDPRLDFLFKPGDWLPSPDGKTTKDIDAVLADWIGGANPITILDLSGIPSTILTDLIGALIRILYDAVFWARNLPEGGRERPLLLVLEEAHAYLNTGHANFASDVVKRIAKEGRKYGVGLMVVSQRPSEIDQTILSQCGTLFAMRLTNDTDRGHVTGSASDNLKGLFDMLPILRTGEAVIVGEAVTLPIRTLIDAPPKGRRPDSTDPRVVVRGSLASDADGYDGPGGWNQRRDNPQNYPAVARQWRQQTPHYTHTPTPVVSPDSPQPTQQEN